MVETPIDPIRMPTITLSEEELDEIEAKMATGELPPDYLERHYQAVANNVFGVDHKRDRKGSPIEQGIGAPGNQTRNSINAYKKWCSADPDYAETLKKMEAQLVDSHQARNAAGGGTSRRERARQLATGRR
jgi:hypothetical protein